MRVELLFRSLPLQSHSRRGAYLWLDRAERSWAEQDAADEAGGGLRRRSLFSILSSTTSAAKWRREAFQVLSAGRRACAQTQKGASVHSRTSARAHTQALDLAIKGAATGRSCREQKVKTYWILVQRASKQTKNGRGSAAFSIQETNPGCTCFQGTAGFYAGMESLLISFCCGVCKWLCEGHFFWGPSTSSPLYLNIHKVGGGGLLAMLPKENLQDGQKIWMFLLAVEWMVLGSAWGSSSSSDLQLLSPTPEAPLPPALPQPDYFHGPHGSRHPQPPVSIYRSPASLRAGHSKSTLFLSLCILPVLTYSG